MTTIKELYIKATEEAEGDQIADFCRTVGALYDAVDALCMDLFISKETAGRMKDEIGAGIMRSVTVKDE